MKWNGLSRFTPLLKMTLHFVSDLLFAGDLFRIFRCALPQIFSDRSLLLSHTTDAMTGDKSGTRPATARSGLAK
jgi:hypothetical protein